MRKYSIPTMMILTCRRSSNRLGGVPWLVLPGSNLWIWFHDLPDATADRLLEKHEHKLAFPAGLSGAK